jgi:hypothetical protein
MRQRDRAWGVRARLAGVCALRERILQLHFTLEGISLDEGGAVAARECGRLKAQLLRHLDRRRAKLKARL